MMHYKKHERCLPLRRAKGTNQRKSWDTFGSSRRNIMIRSCAVTPAVSCQAIACRQVKFRTHAEPMPMAKKQPTWLTVYFVQQQQRCQHTRQFLRLTSDTIVHPTRGARTPAKECFGTSHRDTSIEASLGVCPFTRRRENRQ